MSGLVNKIKDAVHGDKKHEQPTGTSGPHDSRTANAADPRVDSDRDHRANPATGTTGSTGTYGSSTTGGAGLGGDNFTQSGTGVTGVPGGHSNTLGSTGNTSSNRGPHDSNLANKADPRVDSDRDHRAAPGSTGVTGNNYGTTGTTGSSGLTGNPGPAPNTAGPHKSDMLNKVDPRVDSDRDGSKTVGQDQTYARSSNTTSNIAKDPTDAAQVPPSVLAKHVGEPAMEHNDHSHDRARRNSSVTHQEAHRGL